MWRNLIFVSYKQRYSHVQKLVDLKTPIYRDNNHIKHECDLAKISDFWPTKIFLSKFRIF